MSSFFKNIFTTYTLSLSIILVCLFQLYFQYSSLITPRKKSLNERDNRDTHITYSLYNRQFDFNLIRIKETFDDNLLMRINFIKNYTLKGFNKLNEKRENQQDIKNFMLLYLLCYDFIFIIFLYAFCFGGFKSGVIIIILQSFKFYSMAKRLKMSNQDRFLYEAVLEHFRDTEDLRESTTFTPEGFQILDFICNLVIILDIIWLIIVYRKKKEEYAIFSKKQILTDDDREDYKIKNMDSNNINNINNDSSDNNQDNNEQKIFSNEKNEIHCEEDDDDNNSENDNNENKDSNEKKFSSINNNIDDNNNCEEEVNNSMENKTEETKEIILRAEENESGSDDKKEESEQEDNNQGETN